jgi:hypothetical protein
LLDYKPNFQVRDWMMARSWSCTNRKRTEVCGVALNLNFVTVGSRNYDEATEARPAQAQAEHDDHRQAREADDQSGDEGDAEESGGEYQIMDEADIEDLIDLCDAEQPASPWRYLSWFIWMWF